MDFLIEALTEWAREVDMSEEDKRDWEDEPMVECRRCGEPIPMGEKDEWGLCKLCASDEDEGEDEEEGFNNGPFGVGA